MKYEYGKLNQLVKETHEDGTVIEYTYDGFGNRKTVTTVKDGSSKTVNASFNIMNQLTKVNDESISYDKNGNRTSDGKFTYTWDAEDNLTAVTKKGEDKPFATYTYDEKGNRIQKTVNGNVTNYFYDGDSLNVLYETDAENNVTKSYTYGDSGQLLSYTENGKKYFYHYNAHGDVIAISDSTGKTVAKYQYDAWGNPTKTEASDEVKDNRYRYAGYQYDEETGLYYLMARYYEPRNGVFLSLDPDPGSEGDSLDQNGYAYGNNNPVMNVDPDGHLVWLAINAGFAAYDGYKAYKSGKGWKHVVGAAALGFVGGARIKAASRLYKAAHSVYVLKKGKKVVYVGRTKNMKRRAAAHKKNHPDARMVKKRGGLTYAQARGLEHRYYLKYGGKKKLRNKIRPISRKNKKYKYYMSSSRRFYR